ncbi:MAG: hypothetical protein ACREDU_09290, partial [Methylocella sp.]
MGALGAIVPGSRLAEPNAVPARPPASRKVEPEAVSYQTIFAADLPDGPDALGLDAPLGLLAGLAAHVRIETPLTIGLFGPSGSGKSFALTKLIRSIEILSDRAAAPALHIGEIVTLQIDAAHIEGHPATALAGALHACLAGTFPSLAAEAARAARDPRAAASEALDRLDTCRRKFEVEKRALDEASARRARLAESILYQTAGSQVDTYTSANKARIKRLLSKL